VVGTSATDETAKTVDFTGVWRALEAWDRERPKRIEFPGCHVQFYRGAMEIPMVAVRLHRPVTPAADRVAAWESVLARFGLVLDCVAVGENYKLNRDDTGEYVGRVLPDALKFHAERILDAGEKALEEIATLYLQLPRAGGARG
jgi:hypothetical protein